MKKIAKILLILTLTLSMLPTAFPASAAAEYYNTFSDNVWDFSDATLGDVQDATYVSTSNTAEVGASIVEIDGMKALKLTAGKTGTSTGPLLEAFPAKKVFNSLNTAFRIRRDGGNAGFEYGARGRDDAYNKASEFALIEMHPDGYIYFMANKVAPYVAGNWYDITMQVDFKTNVGRIGIKGMDETNYKYIDMTWDKYPGCWSTTRNTDLFKSGYTNVDGNVTDLDFRVLPGHGASGVITETNVYITNYMQNTLTAQERVNLNRGIMNSNSENFDDANSIVAATGNATTDQYNGYSNWIISGTGTGKTAGIVSRDVSVSGVSGTTTSNVYEFKFDGTASDNTAMKLSKNTYMTYNDTNKIHRIKFKVAKDVNTNPVQFTVTVRSEYGNVSPITLNTGGSFNLFYQGTSGSNQIGYVSSGTYYDCELIFDPNAGLTAMIDCAGRAASLIPRGQVIGTLKNSKLNVPIAGVNNVTENGLKSKGILLGIDFEAKAAVGSSGAIRIEDIEWDLIPVGEAATGSVKSGYEDAANLEETVYLDYGETLNRAGVAGLTVADVITVKEDETTVTKPVAIKADGDKLVVTVKELESNKTYTVSANNTIPTVSGNATVESSHTFKTVDCETAVWADTPVRDGNAIKAKIYSYYVEDGKPAKLILAYYLGGKLVDVEWLDVTANTREGMFSQYPLKDAHYDTVKAFVWDGFNGMIPYSDVLETPKTVTP